ncbi:hypothetical protein [Pectobacterium versatile]|uniref:hypothetical protein n=1 Tax=Pectobacterium versatile TaxID=2488639 RepID=UPI0038156CE5
MDYEEFSKKLSTTIFNNYNIEINDWKIIKEVLSHMIIDNFHGYGKNVVDFIDRGSWDYISVLSFKDENRKMEIVWDENFLFQASIESIIVINFNESFYLLIKAYYQDEKTLNKLYSSGCRSYKIENFGDYMIEIIRETKSGTESIQIPNINCFTTCIITRPPNGRVTSNHASEMVMHDINLKFALNKFISLNNDIKEIGEYDRDSLQEKGNTARRYFEYVLMLVNVRSGIKFEKDYQLQMLGNLSNVINYLGLPKDLKRDITLAQQTLNSCSHHGGSRIDKNHLTSSINTLLQFANWVKTIDFFKIYDIPKNV